MFVSQKRYDSLKIENSALKYAIEEQKKVIEDLRNAAKKKPDIKRYWVTPKDGLANREDHILAVRYSSKRFTPGVVFYDQNDEVIAEYFEYPKQIRVMHR
jgi:hypothetical protein